MMQQLCMEHNNIIVIEFCEYPKNITLLIGSETKAVFRCQHVSLEAIIGWRVNGSSTGLFPDIITGSVYDNGAL